ncbi:hypothetical protein [Alteromonas flava]|uniref:hypothetical protein n=1 Tax=Alteromonas flava TaxID=2048003 RepID=UPI000C28DA51|nr:hypothetical protein [Alteromonas flava]
MHVQVDTTKPYWTLSRKRSDIDKYPIVMGSFEMPSDEELSSVHALETQLNRPGGPFDFSYTPEHEDTLTLNLKKQHRVFIFDGQRGLWYGELWDTKAPYRETFIKGSVQITSE